MGYIRPQDKDSVQFIVSRINHLEIIIDHFNKYALLTKKRVDF